MRETRHCLDKEDGGIGKPYGGFTPVHDGASFFSRRGFIGIMGVALFTCVLPSILSGCTSTADRTTDASAASQDARTVVSRTLFHFGTVIDISAECSASLMDQVEARLEYFERTLSPTVEGSDVWNINEAQGTPVSVTSETAACIAAALEYARESDGLFDITIGAVSSLWDFVEGVRPSDAAIAAAVRHVDYRGVSLDGTVVTLADPEAKIDLGGIAKGFICDDLVGLLREGGCTRASISLGGNVYVMGESFDGDEWNVGIQDPNGRLNDPIASLACEDFSVVTSGLYERYFTQAGVTYYHILDPKTGFPVDTDLESASITCSESTTADAYSTILFLLGHDRALELVNADARFQAIVVDDAGVATASDGSSFVLTDAADEKTGYVG